MSSSLLANLQPQPANEQWYGFSPVRNEREKVSFRVNWVIQILNFKIFGLNCELSRTYEPIRSKFAELLRTEFSELNLVN